MVVELLDGANQAHVAFLDQVEEGHAAADVLLGNADHKTQVRFGELVLRFLVTLLDQLCVVHLLLGLEQRDAADLLEVHANRVVEGDGVDRLGLGDELLVDLVDGLEVLVAVADLDPHLAKDMEDPLQMIGLDIDLRKGREDVIGREISMVLALDDQRLGGGDQQIGARGRRQGGCSGSGGGGCCGHLNSVSCGAG